MATKSLEAVIFGVDKASATFDKVGQSASEMAGNTSEASDRMGASWTKAAKVVTVAGAAMVAAVLVKGWNRLTGIENAEAKLKGLGHSADEVTLIMGNALAAVKGTAFGLGDAATVAANAVAAGIKPGKDLESTLKLVADSAAIAGVDLGTMGSIFNKVAANGKLTGDVLQQLNDQGIPVLKFLSDQLGVTQTDVRDMVSKGQIDFATFSAAMEKGVGGAALAMGDTTTGALMNMSAAAGRFGADLLKDVQPMVKSFADSAIKMFDAIGPPIKSLVGLVMAIPGPVKAAAVAFAAWKIVSHTAAFGKLTTAMAGFRDEMALQKGLAKMGGEEISSMGAAATVAKGKMAAFGKTLAKGGLLAGGLILLTSIVDGFTHVNQAVEDVKNSVTDLGKQLVDNNGKWDESIQKAYESSVTSSDLFKALVADGADYGKTLAALTGQTGLYSDSTAEVRKHLGALSMDQVIAIDSMVGMKDATIASAKSQDEYNKTVAKAAETTGSDLVKANNLSAASAIVSAASVKMLASAQDDSRQSTSAAAEATAKFNEVTSQSAKFQDDAKTSAIAFKSAMADAKSPTDLMKDAIDGFGQKTSDADTQLKFFSMSIDAMTGRSISMDDAMKMLNDQVRNMTSTWADATTATKGHNQTLLNVDGTINTVTESGSKLYDAVGSYRSAYDNATTAAYQNSIALGDSADALEQAGDAADEAREKFIKQATAAGLTRAQADKLADSMGILEGKKLTDKDFAVKADDQATAKMASIQSYKIGDKTFTVTALNRVVNMAEQSAYTAANAALNHADGGWITGGIPGRDSVLINAMPGEAVIPATSAAANRPLINALINGSKVSHVDGRSIASSGPSNDGALLDAVERLIDEFHRMPQRSNQFANAGRN